MNAIRAPENPIVIPDMVLASRPDMEVVGVFNAGATRFGDDTVLLLRISEAPRKLASGGISAAIYNADTRCIEIKRWMENTKGLDASDPRAVIVEGTTWLTSMSHLRVARSRDGIHFEVEGTPALSPSNQYEAFGIEDPRITLLDGTYWINCTQKKTNVYVTWKDFLGSEEIPVTTRIGKAEAQTRSWTLSTDNTATFFPGNAVAFVKSLLTADTVVMRTTPYNESPVTAVFAVGGLGAKIAPLQDACGWQ